MNRKTILFGTVILALGAGVALADTGRSGAPLAAFDFAAADVDGNGTLSPEEFGAQLLVLRDAAQSERRATRQAEMIGAITAAGDANGDGLLSAEELAAGLASLDAGRDGPRGRLGEGWRGEHRGWMDADDDGEHRRGRMRGEGYGRMHDDDERGEYGRGQGGYHARGDRDEMRGGGRGEQDGAERIGRLFARIDANDDGAIDAAELAEARGRMIERLEQRLQQLRDNG